MTPHEEYLLLQAHGIPAIEPRTLSVEVKRILCQPMHNRPAGRPRFAMYDGDDVMVVGYSVGAPSTFRTEVDVRSHRVTDPQRLQQLADEPIRLVDEIRWLDGPGRVTDPRYIRTLTGQLESVYRGKTIAQLERLEIDVGMHISVSIGNDPIATVTYDTPREQETGLQLAWRLLTEA